MSLFVAARDCSARDRPFTPLVDKPLTFHVKADGRKSKRRSVKRQKIPTDHLYIRGAFSAVSLIVYGYIDDKLTQSIKLDHEAMERAHAAAFDPLRFSRDPLELGGADVLHLVDEFATSQAMPKRTPDHEAQGLLLDAAQRNTYANLRVLQPDYYPPNHDEHAVAESVGIFAELCRELLALHESVPSEEEEQQQRKRVEVGENVLGCLRSDVYCEIVARLTPAEDCAECGLLRQVVQLCCRQLASRTDVALWLDVVFAVLDKSDVGWRCCTRWRGMREWR